jgi:hypothetical protein
MPVARTDNTAKDYNYMSGGFRGLYTAADPHLIPDGYLSAMKNLTVDEHGVIHSIPVPSLHTGGINGRMVFYCGSPVYQNYAEGSGEYHYGYTSSGTIVTVGGGNIASLAAMDAGFSPGPLVYYQGGGYDWTLYLNRFYFIYGNVLRYSGVSNLRDPSTWSGANSYNFQVFPYPIYHIQPLQSGLYVIGQGVISRLTEPKTGSTSEVYYGPRTPVSDGITSNIFNNGSSIVYCSTDGIYEYGGGGDPQRLDSALEREDLITRFYVYEYANRLWVLEWISDIKKLYAVNKTTGYWEYYDVSDFIDGKTFSMLAWPRWYGDSPFLPLYEGDVYNNGIWYELYLNDSETEQIPWSFTTKDFTPSFDAYSRAVHTKFFYLGRNILGTPAYSLATLKLYGDGVLIDTQTVNMAGVGLLHKDFDCVGTLANSYHIEVSGEGKADIVDVGIEFSLRRKGDNNA